MIYLGVNLTDPPESELLLFRGWGKDAYTGWGKDVYTVADKCTRNVYLCQLVDKWPTQHTCRQIDRVFPSTQASFYIWFNRFIIILLNLVCSSVFLGHFAMIIEWYIWNQIKWLSILSFQTVNSLMDFFRYKTGS